MGFLCVDIEVPKLVAGLLNLLAQLKLMLLVALFDLGLINPPDQEMYSWGVEQTTPSLSVLLTIKSPVVLDRIKKRLPIVEFGDFMDRSGGVCDALCAVCLSYLERRHEMRELSNCCHVFHRECLDKWVDESHVTCPLCRSKLLPIPADNIGAASGGEDLWMVERISYLFGGDL